MTMNAIDGFEHIGLKPRQLQLIVALDDLRSISKVAHYVKITQPAVSKALAELERGYRHVGFDGGSRRIGAGITGPS